MLSFCARHVLILLLTVSKKEGPWQLPIIVSSLVTFTLSIYSLTFVEQQALNFILEISVHMHTYIYNIIHICIYICIQKLHAHIDVCYNETGATKYMHLSVSALLSCAVSIHLSVNVTVSVGVSFCFCPFRCISGLSTFYVTYNIDGYRFDDIHRESNNDLESVNLQIFLFSCDLIMQFR